jgi:hypothetical protein
MLGIFLFSVVAFYVYLFFATLRERDEIAKALRQEEERQQGFLIFLQKVRLTALARNQRA